MQGVYYITRSVGAADEQSLRAHPLRNLLNTRHQIAARHACRAEENVISLHQFVKGVDPIDLYAHLRTAPVLLLGHPTVLGAFPLRVTNDSPCRLHVAAQRFHRAGGDHPFRCAADGVHQIVGIIL